ncbi:MAG: hypothetical protein WCT05_08365 [Lentisphaeria bacterium]
MVNFVRTISTAVCWSRQACYVVRLQRLRDKFKVLACWQAQVSKEQSLAELIALGVKSVEAADQEFIVAGAENSGWGTADLLMPVLSGVEMNNALQFELRKQTPVATEKLRWGYRITGSLGKDNRSQVRLFYIKDDEWLRWCNALKGLSHVDVILPAQLALDPLFAEADCFFPEETGTTGYWYRRVNEARVIVRSEDKQDLTLEQAFPPINRFLLGPLQDKSSGEQLAFIPALLAASYALTRNSNQDQNTLIPPPDTLKAHRFIASKILAFGLLFFVCITLLLGLARQLQARAAHLRRIDTEIGQVRAQLKALQANHGGTMEKEFVAILEQELKDNTRQMPSFPEVLLELTTLIEPPTWASSRMEWNAGQISLQLQSSHRDLELAGKLEESPLLGDVRELSSSYNQGTYVSRFALNARYDTPDEKVEFEQRRAKRLEEQRQREQDKALQQQQENLEKEESEIPAAEEAEEVAPAELLETE